MRCRVGRILLALAAVGLAYSARDASAAVAAWDGGGDGVTWEDPANWSNDTLPGPADLVFNNGLNQAVPGNVTLGTSYEIDALRFAEGRDLNHSAGTLTVGAGGPDTESSFPEFGGGTGTYTMSGTAGYNQTDGGLFILGRAGAGELFMSDNASMTSVGEIWFGMDSTFVGTVSGNASVSTTNEAAVQMARFASPSSLLTFEDSSSLNVDGFFVMSDLAGVSGSSLLTLDGSSLDIDVDGLFMRQNATLSFVADVAGISTVDLGGPADLFDNNGGLDPQLAVDLSLFPGVGPITLIDKTTPGTVNGQFRNLPEGTVVPGTGGRTISYVGGADGVDVVLSAIPEPSAVILALLGTVGLGARRRR